MVMTETPVEFQVGLQIGGQMVTNLLYADGHFRGRTIQELVDRLDRVNRECCSAGVS